MKNREEFINLEQICYICIGANLIRPKILTLREKVIYPYINRNTIVLQNVSLAYTFSKTSPICQSLLQADGHKAMSPRGSGLVYAS